MTDVEADSPDDERGSRAAAPNDAVPDPRDTDHPTGDDDAQDNVENESPG
jgi:hypothetical protein